MEGALSPLDDLLDIAVAWMLIRLLGWHWAFLPSFVAKVVPGVDVVPTWTMAVLVATRGAPREEAKIEPPIIMDRPALERLAELLTRRNQIDEEIAGLIGRPALAGHIGEWIAAQIFNVRLHSSATQRGSDGCFSDPPFAGRTVNVKVYGKREGILDVKKGEHQPDFYLVLTGPKAPALSSRGTHRPFVISEAFLFEAVPLVERLKNRGIQIGVATSLTAQEWEAARIYPECRNSGLMRLRPDQVSALVLFGGSSLGRTASMSKSQSAT